MSDGNIQNPLMAGRAREYGWKLMRRCWPRKSISIGDIDFIYERFHRYILYEMKCEKAGTVPTGQSITLEHLLEDLDGKAILFVVWHPDLMDYVEVPTDVTGFEIWNWHGGQIHRTRYDADHFESMVVRAVNWCECSPYK